MSQSKAAYLWQDGTIYSNNPHHGVRIKVIFIWKFIDLTGRTLTGTYNQLEKEEKINIYESTGFQNLNSYSNYFQYSIM